MTTSQEFHALVAADFQTITKLDKSRVLVAAVTGDALWKAYLAAFPEGTNPIFKTKTEHDCSTCRNFIRHAGNVVGVSPTGTLSTVWDTAARVAPAPYNLVAEALRMRVIEAGIKDLFRVGPKENEFGSKQTRSLDTSVEHTKYSAPPVLTWHHLHTGPMPKALQSTTPDAEKGNHRTTVQVFERGLTELKPSAVTAVLDLIEANALYRGAEFREALLAFQKAQTRYIQLSTTAADDTALTAGLLAREVFVWTEAVGPASRFRNTAMGTLVIALSEGEELEKAVGAFERMVAPTNYKRPTALVTPGMVKKAMETITELGLEPSLERRFARFSDISVGDVLWVDNASKSKLKGGLMDTLLAATAPALVDASKAEDIGMERFITEVLPEATSVEAMFTGRHTGNLVTLTAPVHPEPKQLFKWNTDFAWAYAGGITDSIAERVKRAGGKVEGAALRVSLSWVNHDDLDLHVLEPGAGGMQNRIYFGAKRGQTGGELDVDMNAHSVVRNAVENIVWMRPPTRDGVYDVVVNNFNQRQKTDVGFEVEVECAGKVTNFAYNKTVRDKSNINVVKLSVKGGLVERMEVVDEGISTSAVSRNKWGIDTEKFVKVTTVTRSPNHWGDNATGNKHTIFVLDGCACDEPVRGIFNEFLHSRLEEHRKVFELIGEKTKCPAVPADQQLSGLGFSSTKPDAVLLRVQQGKRQRLYNVLVGSAEAESSASLTKPKAKPRKAVAIG